MAGNGDLVSAFRAEQARNQAGISGKGITPTGKSGGGNAILAAARAKANAPKQSAPQEPQHQPDAWEQFMASMHDVSEKPVIKQILDVISTPLYAVTNSLSNVQHEMYDASARGQARANAKGETEPGGDLGNRLQTMGEGLGGIIPGIVKGVGQGLSAGLGGNRNDAKSTSDIIRDAQAHDGIDTNSSESKWVQGLGGLAGDIALDPSNAIASAAKLGEKTAGAVGGVRGALQFKAENALAQKGNELAEGVAPTRWDNVKQEANKNIAKYRDNAAQVAQLKQANKETRKFSDSEKADYLLGNITTLHPAVAKSMAEKLDAPALMEKVAALPPTKQMEAVEKLSDTPKGEAATAATEVIPSVDNAVENLPEPEVIPEVAKPSTGLSSVKAPTQEERLWDSLSKMRGTKKTPVYDAQTIKNVNEALSARPFTIRQTVPGAKTVEPMTEANKVPDFKATIDKLNADKKEFSDPKNPKYEPSIPVVGADGKKHPFPIVDIVNGMDHHTFSTLPKEYQIFKGPEARQLPPTTSVIKNPKALTDAELQALGIDAAHVPLIKNGTAIQDIVDHTSVGDLRQISADIKNGVIGKDAIKPLYETLGTKDPKEISKLINQIVKSDSFKEVADKMKAHGSERTGIPMPSLGVSGHAKSGIPGKGFTADDILAAKTPANPEQTRKFLESTYTQAATSLAEHPRGAELRGLADEAFRLTVGGQRTPAGPLRSRQGASVSEALDAAKYETKYNTHSGMARMKYLLDKTREMNFANKTQQDRAFMLALTDVDNRLRLAGFDQHLSNMQEVGDKLIVRLAPSDILGSMTASARIKYLHGNLKWSKTSLPEFLPTSFLDLGEVLVRSATKLKADGSIDFEAMINKAMHTLQGEYSKVSGNKRVLSNTLDSHVRDKNSFEILREIDNRMTKAGTKTNYGEQFKKASGPAEKQAVVDLAMNMHADEFRKVSEARLTTHVNDLIHEFTKGMKDGKPSIVSNLININMRNAALMGGNVSREIGEASAEFSQKVLDSLESGSVGSHLSELVGKPPYPTTDKAAKAIVEENRKAVQHSVATPEEVAHATALDKNVKAKEPVTKAQKKAAKAEANKVNAEAFQHEPALIDELAKPAKDIDKEATFDLAIREMNKDLLYRMYGTSRWFNKRTGMPITFEALQGGMHATSAIMTGFHGILRDMRRAGYTSEQLRVAFNELKTVGVHDQITGELNAVLSLMFDPDKVNFLSRNSVGPEHFNKILKSVGFEDRFRVPVDATRHEMMNAWKDWDIVNVEDFFSKMMGAMTKTAQDVSMGASFSKHFGQATPGKGMVKIVDTSVKDGNPFIDLIDTNLYYPKEVAQEMVHIGRLLTESRSFTRESKLYTFVNKIMDPLISNLKMTQTTLKPGHHVMSIIGDGWRNNLALDTIGYGNPAKQLDLYRQTARIMYASIGEIEELSNFQKLQRTQGLVNEVKLASDGHSGFEYFGNIAGGGKISRQDIYKIAEARGWILPAHLGGSAEDMLTSFDELNATERASSRIVNAVSKTTEMMDRMANPIKPKFGMKNPYSINKFTAHRDTFTRLPMFLGAMRSRNFKSLDEAVEFASNFGRKWAPTAQDLGAAESKYARRMVFYYTWTRGMVPRIIESAITHPGTAMLPYKGAYNLAVANGLDPQSFGDPFPADLLLPSWYSSKVIGPQFKAGDWLSNRSDDLYGINPTGPFGDILNQFGSDVKPKDFLNADAFTKTAGTFLNMSNPFFKAPAEIMTGRTLQSGSPVTDPGEYLQDMVGPARTLSHITGHELFPSIAPSGDLALAKRTESKYSGKNADQAHNVVNELLNWGTGLGFTNYSSDGTKKSAEFQQKDAKTQAKKEASRY